MRLNTWFNLFLLLLSLVFVIGSFQYGPSTRFMPLVIGVPLLVLMCLKMYGSIRKPLQVSFEKSELLLIGWFCLLIVMIYLIGLPLAAIFFIILFLWLYSKERWWLILPLAGCVWLVVVFIFGGLLEVPFEKGILNVF